jgi:serine/threonine protein kinase
MPKSLSEEAKDVLSCILKRNPDRRISIPEIKKHHFFGDISWEKLEAKQYKLPAL